MRLSFWQFALIVVIAAAIWYVVFVWGQGQDGKQWIKSMNGFIFSSEHEREADKAVDHKQQSGGEGWI